VQPAAAAILPLPWPARKGMSPRRPRGARTQGGSLPAAHWRSTPALRRRRSARAGYRVAGAPAAACGGGGLVTGDDLASRMRLELSEIGVDMTRFPTAGHLVSWAKHAPKANQSAGKSNPRHHQQGQPLDRQHPRRGGIGAARTKTSPGSRYHRLASRRGKQRALAAVGNSTLTIAWHLLPDPQPTSPTSAPTGTTGPPRSAASASSSPNWNASPGRKSPPRTPPPNQPPIQTRLRCAPPGAAARPATVSTDFRFRRVDARGSKDVSALSGVGNPGFNPPSVRPSWIDMRRHPAPRMRGSSRIGRAAGRCRGPRSRALPAGCG
jgi:Transposase IS116/IS110/IS902 family